MSGRPELLAPAGNVESFYAAVENGADSVYLGLKRFSARATASNFTMEELATIIPFAHGRGVKVYVALNSLITVPETPELLDTLYSLSTLKPDALIVQDPGIFFFVKRYFPALQLHASTLAAAHNSAGVNALERMGAKRIVLARELTLSEISSICSSTRAELEIFVHGALCYSYSGLCLTSGYRGGRSGLRGECVQPCRLKFRQGKKEGFYLSCNDLCALPLIPALKRLRISGLKIEGRMKPASYIATVVKAYRTVLDAGEGAPEQDALNVAREMLSRAPSRQLTLGYLESSAAPDILKPHRSGSSGIWLGTVRSVSGDRVSIDLRHEVEQGDRIRPESSGGKEEGAFTVTDLFDPEGRQLTHGAVGTRISLLCPKKISVGDRLFKVGSKTAGLASIWRKIRQATPSTARFKTKFPDRQTVLEQFSQRADNPARERENLMIKVGSPGELVEGLQSGASRIFISGTRSNLERIAKQRFSAAQMRKIGISLPALLFEEKDMEYYRAAVGWLAARGFQSWEMNNWGHFDLFGKVKDVRLIAGWRLNIRNESAIAQTMELGCSLVAHSLEVNKTELELLGRTAYGQKLIVTVYAWPPLFISRLSPELSEDKPFKTPRGDVYHLKKQGGGSLIFADRP
ncbi:MAG: peptidase U32 family protein, partial [Syntrophobacteraceae bacterium]